LDRRNPFTVKEITRQIKDALETVFPPLWVEGEVSGFRAASSGHFYFSLKDDEALIRAVMFRREAGRLPFLPADGMHVLVFARLTVYESRGDYQLIIEDMEPRGAGALYQALEKLRVKLEAEGLFLPERKRSLPLFPACVGVVTSATGAAIRDILKVLEERESPVNLILSPALVQGREAPDSLISALQVLVEHGQADVVIIGRGGGSFEDLLPFSDERVVRAVAGCPLPIISAVGHEIDITLADLAADVRAPTPSAAAEMVVAGKKDFLAQIDFIGSRLASAQVHVLRDMREQVQGAGSRLVHPRYLLDQGWMRLDDLSFRLVSHSRARLQAFRADLSRLSGLLGSLGPQAVLDRGYALVQKEDGSVVRSPKQVAVGEGLDIRVAEGKMKVKRVKGKGEASGRATWRPDDNAKD